MFHLNALVHYKVKHQPPPNMGERVKLTIDINQLVKILKALSVGLAATIKALERETQK